jgi:hypothetical protein
MKTEASSQKVEVLVDSELNLMTRKKYQSVKYQER